MRPWSVRVRSWVMWAVNKNTITYCGVRWHFPTRFVVVGGGVGETTRYSEAVYIHAPSSAGGRAGKPKSDTLHVRKRKRRKLLVAANGNNTRNNSIFKRLQHVQFSFNRSRFLSPSHSLSIYNSFSLLHRSFSLRLSPNNPQISSCKRK